MAVIVETRAGRVEGETREGHVVFRGVPYAQPPVGELRFRAPEPVRAHAGVRDARSFGPSAIQGTSMVPAMAADGAKSEDCLYLNVYTPAADGSRRPVMVWIHGGAFILGSASSPIYDGGRLCVRGDVVVVTINYRLGVLGYLSLQEHGGPSWGASANLGQLDQIEALRWVRDNIAAFGGDPRQVTIFGESAGSVAVCTLLAMPEANGLFHRAIAQSGAMPLVQGSSRAARTTAQFLKALGLADAQVERLRSLPVEQLLAAQEALGMERVARLGLTPVVDGVTLPKTPLEMIESGQVARVPLVIGSNRDEMNLFLGAKLKELDRPMSDAEAVAAIRAEARGLDDARAALLLEAYRSSRQAYDLPHQNRALLAAVQGDVRFRVPSLRFAEAYLRQEPSTFMYLFTYQSPAMRGAMRACHALEIPFVFGTLDAPFQDRFAGTGPEVEQLSATMMDAWLAHARHGKPHAGVTRGWVAYETDHRPTMIFDRESRLELAPYEEERAAWTGVEL